MKVSCFGYLDCYNIIVIENQETAPDVSERTQRIT